MDKAHFAASEGLLSELHALHEQRSNLTDEDDVGLAPIHHAARFGHVDCVQFLISAGVKPSQRSLQQQTPLHYAAQQGHDAVVELLLRSDGVHIGELDHDGWTALHHAAYNGRSSTVSLLVKRGADMGIKNQLYCTPLHVACTAGQRDVIALLICLGAQTEFAAPLLRPLQMLPLPAAPTEMEEGPLLEQSVVGAALGTLLRSGHSSNFSDCELVAQDGHHFHLHKAVLAVRAPLLLALIESGSTTLASLSSRQLAALLHYVYTGMVGSFLLQGAQAAPQELDADMCSLVELMQASRLVGMADVARTVQRSVIARIGKGPPVGADGFNADLELLARVVQHSNELDPDFRLLIGFFVHGNFSVLLQYFIDRSAVGGYPGLDKLQFTRALCSVLPVDAKVKFARPSRWRHIGVPPMRDEHKQLMQALVVTVKSDKLSNWFHWPVSAIDYSNPSNRKSTIPDYWAACQYPMHLEGVSQRLNSDYYVSPEETVNDLRLVFCNAMKYNDESSDIWEHAVALYYLVGQLYSNNANKIDVSQLPAPFEKGTLDDWVDTSLPNIKMRVQRAFASGRAPDPEALSVDPQNASSSGFGGGGGGGSNRKAPKSKSSASKRGRKELKESDWKPVPLGSSGGSSRKRVGGGGGGSKKSKPEQAHQEPYQQQYLPPPMPLPDMGDDGGEWMNTYAAPPPPPPVASGEVSYEEKARIGESIQQLLEDEVVGVFQIIQRGSGGGLVQGAGEEVELDLNSMSNETLREVQRYVNQCLAKRG